MVNEDLKELIQYRLLNLTNRPYPIPTNLDLIFCRNVMIYFETEMRCKMAREFEKLLKPGGYLIVGHVENIRGMAEKLKGKNEKIRILLKQLTP